MDKILELISLCKCSVSIMVNHHKDCYQAVDEYIFETDEINEIDKDVYSKMIDLDKVIEIYLYPDTPIGFYKIYHYDLEKAVDIALDTLKN